MEHLKKYNNYINEQFGDDWEIDDEEPIVDNNITLSNYSDLVIGDKVEYVYNEEYGCDKKECNLCGKREILNGKIGEVVSFGRWEDCKHNIHVIPQFLFRSHSDGINWYITDPRFLKKN